METLFKTSHFKDRTRGNHYEAQMLAWLITSCVKDKTRTSHHRSHLFEWLKTCHLRVRTPTSHQRPKTIAVLSVPQLKDTRSTSTWLQREREATSRTLHPPQSKLAAPLLVTACAHHQPEPSEDLLAFQAKESVQFTKRSYDDPEKYDIPNNGYPHHWTNQATP